jgi:ABC-type antimicrobial peptide transport system permease subunit
MSILSRAFGQIVIGIIVGIAIAAAFDHAIDGGWTGRRGTVLLPVVAGLMAAIGLIATLGSARRALQIQPTEALRSD